MSPAKILRRKTSEHMPVAGIGLSWVISKRRAATLMNKYLIVGIGGFIGAIARF